MSRKMNIGKQEIVLHCDASIPSQENQRSFKNITAKEREQMLSVWNKNKGKSNLNSSLSLELTRAQQEQLSQQLSHEQYQRLMKGGSIKTVKGLLQSQVCGQSQAQTPMHPQTSKGVKGTEHSNSRRLSLPNENELAAARALTQLPLFKTPTRVSAQVNNTRAVPTTRSVISAVTTTSITTPTSTPTSVVSKTALTNTVSVRESLCVSGFDSMGKLRSGKSYSPSSASKGSPYNLRDKNPDRLENPFHQMWILLQKDILPQVVHSSCVTLILRQTLALTWIHQMTWGRVITVIVMWIFCLRRVTIL